MRALFSAKSASFFGVSVPHSYCKIRDDLRQAYCKPSSVSARKNFALRAAISLDPGVAAGAHAAYPSWQYPPYGEHLKRAAFNQDLFGLTPRRDCSFHVIAKTQKFCAFAITRLCGSNPIPRLFSIQKGYLKT